MEIISVRSPAVRYHRNPDGWQVYELIFSGDISSEFCSQIPRYNYVLDTNSKLLDIRLFQSIERNEPYQAEVQDA